jgi:hypothetical protein
VIATIAPEMGSFWTSARNLFPRRLVVVPDERTTAVSTLAPRAYVHDWREAAIQQALEVLSRYSAPQAVRTARRLVDLLNRLPMEMPAPFIAGGDDGSIGLEWDVAGFELHINLTHDQDEAYFRSPVGDEWEGTISSSNNGLMEAVRRLASAR